jgi:hypothetical protein
VNGASTTVGDVSLSSEPPVALRAPVRHTDARWGIWGTTARVSVFCVVDGWGIN